MKIKTGLAVGAAVVALLAVGTGGAVAQSLVTSRDIKDGTVRVKDMRAGAIKQFSKPGPAGATGATGATGAKGATGAQGLKGDKGDDGVLTVTAAGNGFFASNPSVHFTDNGVTFGEYTNNSAGDQTSGGTLRYSGLAGLHLRDIAELTYSASYTHDGATADNGDAPYLRIFIDDPSTPDPIDHDIVFSPSTQPGACYGTGGGGSSSQCLTSGRLVKYDVHLGTVRYDDDADNGPDSTWDAIVNQHGDDLISTINVSTGNSLPGTQAGTLNSLRYEVAGHAPKLVSFSK